MTGTAVRVHTLAPGVPGGPTVVLAHGLEDSWASWLLVAGELDPAWRLIALDLPWRPGNDYRWRTRSIGDWLGDALDLVDTRPDVLVAHSFGANATLQLLCDKDSRVAPVVVLICPLYRPPGQPVTWRVFDLARSRFVEHVREGLRARMGARLGAVEPATLEAMMDVALNRVGPTGFLTTFHEFVASADLPLANIEVPTFVIAGEADPSLPRESALVLGDAIPGVRLRINDDYDHFCHVRQARGVAAQVLDFVAAGTSTRTVGEPQ